MRVLASGGTTMRAGPRLLLLCLAACAATAPAAAQFGAPAGWGLRLGVTDDPDQVVGGFHVSFGDVVPRLRLQPSLELGSGDDTTVLTLTLPVHYRVAVTPPWRPYFGGGLVLSSIERDPPRGGPDEEDEFDIGPVLVGGVEWPLAGGRDLLLELNLGGGESYDAKVVVGVTF
jgi:hypothetical protein